MLHPSCDDVPVSRCYDEMSAKKIIDEVNKGNYNYAGSIDNVVKALVSRVAYLERMIDALASRELQ